MQLKDAVTTVMSTVALLFSAYSLYESSLRGPQLSVHVAPRIDYTDPDRPTAVREVFVLPLTLANDGARGATVLGINLEVTNPRTKQSKIFYAARLGSWGETPLKPFAPVVLSGKAIYSQALQFEPRPGETVPTILDQTGGDYTFKLTLDNTATGEGGAPLQFEMRIGELDYRNFQGTGTMAMWAPSFRPPTNAGR